VKLQAAVMFLRLGATATTTADVAFGVWRRLFTTDHRLVVPARTQDSRTQEDSRTQD
jgi:ABC-type iron transport system FetAB permease component